MARYDQAHKEATRARILETAGRRLKQDGIDGAGVAVLMKDAGLTNGAFYAHFDSKDDLVAHVVTDQIDAQVRRLEALDAGAAGLVALVAGYLSVGHRDAPADGCPSAALLDEISRGSQAVRSAYTEGMLAVADEIGSRLGHRAVDQDARALVLAVYGLMIGAMQLSRTLTDADLAVRVLEQAERQALLVLGLSDPESMVGTRPGSAS